MTGEFITVNCKGTIQLTDLRLLDLISDSIELELLFEKVDYTYVELENTANKINSFLVIPSAEIAGYAIDTMNNQVIIYELLKKLGKN